MTGAWLPVGKTRCLGVPGGYAGRRQENHTPWGSLTAILPKGSFPCNHRIVGHEVQPDPAINSLSSYLYRRIRLATSAFLLLILMLWPDFVSRRPDLPQSLIAVGGLVVFCVSYVRVVFRSIPPSGRLSTPWALAGVAVSGLALIPELPDVWIYYFPFYLTTCLVITRRSYATLLSGTGVLLLVVTAIGIARGLTPLRLGVLATQLAVFSLTLTGIHRVLEFIITQWRTQKAAERLATERERRRLARDLHDVVGRNLVALAMRTEVVAQREPHDGMKEELHHLAALARTTLNSTLAVVEEMRAPDIAAELGEARELLGWAGIDLTVSGDRAEAHRRAPFAWFVREAVTNVVKHSQARTCRVIFGPGRLTVEDDGRPAWPIVPGAGLTGMRERLEQAGGELRIERSEEGGIRVIASLAEEGWSHA